jgi:hypothetical protein
VIFSAFVLLHRTSIPAVSAMHILAREFESGAVGWASTIASGSCHLHNILLDFSHRRSLLGGGLLV